MVSVKRADLYFSRERLIDFRSYEKSLLDHNLRFTNRLFLIDRQAGPTRGDAQTSIFGKLTAR